MEWMEVFAEWAAQYPEVGEARGPIAYIAPDFLCAVQLGPRHLLIWDGNQVTALSLPQVPIAPTPPEPDLWGGFQLRDYQRDWDKPDQQVMVEQGTSRLMVWSVKRALARGGIKLDHPAPAWADSGWRTYPAGFPVPPEWLGRGS